MTTIHRPARLATRAASFRYGGRHHSGIPGGIIPLHPGGFVGIGIADPELWTERYHCPTWHDYLRQRTRSTASERALHLRANEFHMGPEPIRIRPHAGSPDWIRALERGHARSINRRRSADREPGEWPLIKIAQDQRFCALRACRPGAGSQETVPKAKPGLGRLRCMTAIGATYAFSLGPLSGASVSFVSNLLIGGCPP